MTERIRDPMLTEEQTVYLQEVFDKFNADPFDESLKDFERLLMNKFQEVQEAIAKSSKEIDGVNEDINKLQDKGNSLVKRITHLRGQSQGFLDSLLALR